MRVINLDWLYITKINLFQSSSTSSIKIMSFSRPVSRTTSCHYNNKPAFQKKIRPRIRGLYSEDQFNISSDLNRQQKSRQLSQSRTQRLFSETSQPINDRFNQTASQLTKANFYNHCSQTCVCNQCSCGRHLCKFNNIKPDLTKKTVYKSDFSRKEAAHSKVVYAKQYNRLQGPHLDMNSTQRVSFKQRQSDKIERPRPQDLLKSYGPAQILTTYKSLFPGHKCSNQYVKPTDKHIRQKFPLRSKSTYTKNYVNKDIKKSDYKYFNDQLKTGGNWYGNSSYGKSFQNPNPQYHATKVKITEKLELNPGFKHQYETVYKNDFIPKQSVVCGSKILLQTRGRGQFSKSKNQFAQNTDFKAMSPEYHAFSTSGFSYV